MLNTNCKSSNLNFSEYSKSFVQFEPNLMLKWLRGTDPLAKAVAELLREEAVSHD